VHLLQRDSLSPPAARGARCRAPRNVRRFTKTPHVNLSWTAAATENLRVLRGEKEELLRMWCSSNSSHMAARRLREDDHDPVGSDRRRRMR
jgi:hypothetical protein